jgi:hypothetical protein
MIGFLLEGGKYALTCGNVVDEGKIRKASVVRFKMSGDLVVVIVVVKSSCCGYCANGQSTW